MPERSQTPFAGELTQFKNNSRIKKLPEAPNRIIKEQSFRDREEYTRDVIAAKLEFEELEQGYGIKNAGFRPVLAKNEKGETVIFNVADRLRGVSLEKAKNPLPLAAVDKIDNFYEGLFSYYHERCLHGKPYLGDIHSSQVMYGHMAKEKVNDIYIHDNEPIIRRNRDERYMLIELRIAIPELLEVEKKIQNGPVKLTKARKIAVDILQILKRKGLIDSDLEHWTKTLEMLKEGT